MMWLIAQAASTTAISYEVPPWIGGLGGSALLGVLFYYVLTKQMPEVQKQFHETLREERQQFRDALDKERDSREKIAEKTFLEHREAVKSIIEHDERRHDNLIMEIRQIRAQV
jgi:flagellar biosynthesis component FlhA